MSLTDQNNALKVVIERDEFQSLLDALHSRKFKIIGPTIDENAVIFDRIDKVEDFPIGWIDRQNHGSYHLSRNKKKTLFGYVVGPHSWKKFLYPPQQLLLEASRDGNGFELKQLEGDEPDIVFFGIRSCEIHALGIYDKVMTEGPYVDSAYARRRKKTFIVAVNCTRTGGNCFCRSMDTGPKADGGYDIALTEIINDDYHYFLAASGSKRGREVLNDIPHRDAGEAEIEAAEKALKNAESRMGRNLDTSGLPELLKSNFDNTHWDEIGERCLSCGNCTMVCPTCFCTTMEDRTDLPGQTLQRWRLWDSCHNVEFSYIHGGSIRSSSMSRYRQWMMHKLAYWPEQFGTFGCVGCGRCITWCPVGIDITEEAAVIRKSE